MSQSYARPAREAPVRPIRYLTLVLTGRCNLRCAYCYRGENGNQGAMPLAVAMAALAKAHEGGKPFHVQLTGGEPLLEPELLGAIVGHIRANNLKASIALQSNGTLMTREMAEFLKVHQVSLGISLDGPPDIQETLRGGSRALLRGLEELERAALPFTVTAVLTREALPTLRDLPVFLARYSQARGVAFDLPVRKGRMQPSMFPEKPALTSAVRGFLDSLDTINQHLRRQLTLREREMLQRARKRQYVRADAACAPDGKTYDRAYCHVSSGESLAVFPDGSCAECGQGLEYSGGEPVAKRSVLAEYRLSATECSGCALAGFCPGDCPSRLFHNPPEAARLACTLYKTLWREETYA